MSETTTPRIIRKNALLTEERRKSVRNIFEIFENNNVILFGITASSVKIGISKIYLDIHKTD